MKTKVLLQKFNNGLLWNGLFYTIYKILFITLSFTLYKTVSEECFSLWATVNSTVFIILLWINCGFKKSIPRFSPAFAKNKKTHHLFINGLLLFQSLLLIFVGLPLLYFVAPQFLPQLSTVMPLMILVFITQGLVSLMQLIFHAHFWQKPFNILQTFFILFETAVNFWLISLKTPHNQLIASIIVSKIATGAGIVIVSFFLLPGLYQDKNYPETEHLNVFQTVKQFMIHSGAMWASSIIKSFSERNILFPYLTVTIGIPTANFFKVAHDGALFFQRVALKTIGVTDTSLLAHIEVDHKKKNIFQTSFRKLKRTVLFLCLVLFTVALLYLNYTTLIPLKGNYTLLFIIITGSYLLEVLLSPYERVLEAKQNYKLLWLAYLPYLLIIFGCIILKVATQISLLQFIMVLHSARLVSALLMMHFAKKRYFTTSPFSQL